METEPPTSSSIDLLVLHLRESITSSQKYKSLLPIVSSNPVTQEKQDPGLLSFPINSFPSVVSMNVNDKFPLGTLKPQLRIDARIISALERGSSGAPFLATVLLVRTLAHAIGKRDHIGYPLRSHCYVQRGVTDDSPADYGNYPPETAFFGGIVGVVFRSSTATDSQLLDIAYFMIRFPSGKIYKFDIDRAVSSFPFPVEGLEEVNMASQDFFSHTCECFIRDRQYSTS